MNNKLNHTAYLAIGKYQRLFQGSSRVYGEWTHAADLALEKVKGGSRMYDTLAHAGYLVLERDATFFPW